MVIVLPVNYTIVPCVSFWLQSNLPLNIKRTSFFILLEKITDFCCIPIQAVLKHKNMWRESRTWGRLPRLPRDLCPGWATGPQSTCWYHVIHGSKRQVMGRVHAEYPTLKVYMATHPSLTNHSLHHQVFVAHPVCSRLALKEQKGKSLHPTIRMDLSMPFLLIYLSNYRYVDKLINWEI